MASKTRENVVEGMAGSPALATPTVNINNAADTNIINDFDVSLMDRVEFGVQNTGANSMVVKVWYQYVDGGIYYQDLGAGNAPTVANGATARLSFPNVTARRLRVTGNGTGATTAKLELHAAGYQ